MANKQYSRKVLAWIKHINNIKHLTPSVMSKESSKLGDLANVPMDLTDFDWDKNLQYQDDINDTMDDSSDPSRERAGLIKVAARIFLDLRDKTHTVSYNVGMTDLDAQADAIKDFKAHHKSDSILDSRSIGGENFIGGGVDIGNEDTGDGKFVITYASNKAIKYASSIK